MGTSFSALRRTLAQRMNAWGGGISSNTSGTFSANGTANTAVDTIRPELDDEWNEAWICVNPGSTDQVGSPTIWRRVASDHGWVQSSGTFTIQGTWPSPYTSGPTAGTSYEIYKVFKPENWIQGVNWALENAYPKRHRPVTFEIPQNYFSRIVDWQALSKARNSIVNPTTTLTVAEIADNGGSFQPGVYTLGFTYYNDMGETLLSPTSTVNIVGTNSRISVAALTNVPDTVVGANYYCSLQPGGSNLDLMTIGQVIQPNIPTTNTPERIQWEPGVNINGTINALQFSTPDPFYGIVAPSYNTTTIDFIKLHHILKRINPGAYPEIWNDLGGDLWKPMGGTKIMLMFFPVQQYNLKFVCTTPVPQMVSETDVTQEPAEMIYAGAEYYLWNLLSKTSTIVNVNWEKLAKDALTNYLMLKNEFAMDSPRDVLHIPTVRVMY